MEQAKIDGKTKDQDFSTITTLLNQLQHYKGKRYGNAWCRHGEFISIFSNLDRKFDRLTNIILQAIHENAPIPEPESEETIMETVGDLATYAILWMTFIKQNRPKEYEAWESRIKQYANLNN